MIEVNTKDGQISISATGDVFELGADACMIVHTIYDRLNARNKDVAEAFRQHFTAAVVSGIVFDTPADEARTDEMLTLTRAIVEMINEIRSGEYDPIGEVEKNKAKGEYEW